MTHAADAPLARPPVPVVLYGVGSPVVVDVEETLHRLGRTLEAGVINDPGPPWLLDTARLVSRDALTAAQLACPFLVPLFAPGNRQAAAREARRVGFTDAAAIVDPTAIVARDFTLPGGGYVNAGCTIGAATAFAEFVFVNRGACIGHHVVFERFASVGPGAVLGGQVQVGRGALVGAGAVVLPGVVIGANAVVGAGAVVTRDVAAHTLVVGNPGRAAKTGIPGYRDVTVD